jgi:hypothetical protein
MAAELEKTDTPGIFRRHQKGCDRRGRCKCAYVVVWRHSGKQHKETHRTSAEAREAKGNRDAGERRPVARGGFEDYFAGVDQGIRRAGRRPASRSGRGRSTAATSSSSRCRSGGRGGSRTSSRSTCASCSTRCATMASRLPRSRGLRSALSALFATAVEDGTLRFNPVHGVRIPGDAEDGSEDEQARGAPRARPRAAQASRRGPALLRGLAALDAGARATDSPATRSRTSSPATMGFSHRARASSDRSVRRWIRILRSSAPLALGASGLIAGKNPVKCRPFLLRAPRPRKAYPRR